MTTPKPINIEFLRARLIDGDTGTVLEALVEAPPLLAALAAVSLYQELRLTSPRGKAAEQFAMLLTELDVDGLVQG